MPDYDVIVAGAGPAGSTAAKLLADAGRSVLLIDRQKFPRHKPCAAWINIAAPRTFPYISDTLGEINQSAFYGLTFLSPDLTKRADYEQDEPAGYLVLRDEFDNRLKDIAIAAGAEFREGLEVTGVQDIDDVVKVATAAGESYTAHFVIGADGVTSTVARTSGLNTGWENRQLVICVNEDIPCDSEIVAKHFGEKPRIFVSPAYGNIAGYGWVFPKREHVCVGLGGRVPGTKNAHIIFKNFFDDLTRTGYIPSEMNWENTDTALNPAGAAAHLTRSQLLARGRVLLAGDAGGFSVGSSGEGIYPGMLSAKEAAAALNTALESGSPDSAAESYTKACRKNLVPYISGINPVGMAMIVKVMYTMKKVAGKAARSYLFGEPFKI
ncbi:MAG: NAD(P)/FAD-dependent oxidoreductase [Planctomycetota bacterium]